MTDHLADAEQHFANMVQSSELTLGLRSLVAHLRSLPPPGREHERKHQASSDAATIAALRRVTDAAIAWRRTIVESGDDMDQALLDAVDALPANLRPSRGETDGGG